MNVSCLCECMYVHVCGGPPHVTACIDVCFIEHVRSFDLSFRPGPRLPFVQLGSRSFISLPSSGCYCSLHIYLTVWICTHAHDDSFIHRSPPMYGHTLNWCTQTLLYACNHVYVYVGIHPSTWKYSDPCLSCVH